MVRKTVGELLLVAMCVYKGGGGGGIDNGGACDENNGYCDDEITLTAGGDEEGADTYGYAG